MSRRNPVRSIKAHITASQETHVIDWASPKQQEAFKYGPVGAGEGVGGPLMISGGFGAAKTWALCLKAMWLSATFPNNRGLIFRKKWTELQRTAMSTFFKICPPEAYDPCHGGRRSDTEKYLRLTNGSEILWMHMDDPDTEGVIRGLEINWFLGDQMEEIEEEIFDFLMGRLGRWDKAEVPQDVIDLETMQGREWSFVDRSGCPLVPTYAMGACNPDTELHWIYRRFHPASEDFSLVYLDSYGKPTSYKQQGYKMIQMASWENKFLPKVNLDILMSKDESFRRRYVAGEWGIPEGQIHNIDDSSYLDWSPEMIDWLRASCYLYRVLDHGDSAPTACGWVAVTREGDVIFYREYYQPNRMISEHRRAIWELSLYENYRKNIADPSIFFKTMQKHGGRWSVSDEYGDMKALDPRTAIFWQPADNNELGTRNRINEFLHLTGSGEYHMLGGARTEKPRHHPITKELGYWPRLFFVRKSKAYPDGCDYIIRETKSQRRQKLGVENGKPMFSDERDDRIKDHGYDLVRYTIADRPAVPRTGPTIYSERTFEGKRRMMKLLKRKQTIAWRNI